MMEWVYTKLKRFSLYLQSGSIVQLEYSRELYVYVFENLFTNTSVVQKQDAKMKSIYKYLNDTFILPLD